MIKSLSEFKATSAQAKENPDTFWSEIASEFEWKAPWKQTLDYDFSKPEIKWFVGGKLNITENCLDRNLVTQPNKTAILFEPNDPAEAAQHITYKELHKQRNNIRKAREDATTFVDAVLVFSLDQWEFLEDKYSPESLKKGMKKMFGKKYPNCVKKEEYSNWRKDIIY